MATTSTVRALVRGSSYTFPGFSAWINEGRHIVHVGLPGLRDATYDISINDIDMLDVDGELLVHHGTVHRASLA